MADDGKIKIEQVGQPDAYGVTYKRAPGFSFAKGGRTPEPDASEPPRAEASDANGRPPIRMFTVDGREIGGAQEVWGTAAFPFPPETRMEGVYIFGNGPAAVDEPVDRPPETIKVVLEREAARLRESMLVQVAARLEETRLAEPAKRKHRFECLEL